MTEPVMTMALPFFISGTAAFAPPGRGRDVGCGSAADTDPVAADVSPGADVTLAMSGQHLSRILVQRMSGSNAAKAARCIKTNIEIFLVIEKLPPRSKSSTLAS